MVTEADWSGWKKSDFTLYLETVLEAFGSERLLFGSDWPVATLAASYEEVVEIVDDFFTNALDRGEGRCLWRKRRRALWPGGSRLMRAKSSP